MRQNTYFQIMVLLNALLFFAAMPISASENVASKMIETEAGELILSQTLVVNSNIEKVWEAYTTSSGWQSWAAPKAEIELKVAGTIKTHYGPDKSIGDPGTITLNIVNYVPFKALTLQAQLSEHWPNIMKEDAENLMNLIVFEELSNDRVKINSYGVGYRNLPEYLELMNYFIPANESLLEKLKNYVEK